MKSLINGLKRHGLGSRTLTETDFHAICAQERVATVWSDLNFSFYFSAHAVRCITLPKRLYGIKLLFHMFHELGHHWTHSGLDPAVHWHDLAHNKNEAEANAIATLAVYPTVHQTPLIDSRYAAHLWQDRLRLHFLYDL